MAFLAASFATGVTLLIAVVPSPLAVFTSAVVVAFSIAVFAAVAFSVALSLAAFFSASDKSWRPSIAEILFAKSWSIAFLAFIFTLVSGLSLLIAVVPVFCACVSAA